ncbi:hypothetical protein I7I48_08796 [Histoplasma ohiense]|nr:hypothetical protein I7I48_08796 [Histoplasma ohiense (nom. inval.)]
MKRFKKSIIVFTEHPIKDFRALDVVSECCCPAIYESRYIDARYIRQSTRKSVCKNILANGNKMTPPSDCANNMSAAPIGTSFFGSTV